MSIESKIDELIAALNANTAALQAAGTSAVAAPASAESASAESATQTSGKGKGSKSTEKTAAEAKADKKPAEDVPSEDKVKQVFGDFMRVDDVEDREKRKTFVKNVLKQFSVAKATELKAEDRAAAIAVIEGEAKKLADAAAAADDDDLV